MVRNKKWTRTSLTRWLKHSINLQSKNPQCQPPQDGNPMELMTRNPTTQTTSQNTIKKIINSFHLSRLRTDNFVQIQSIKTSSNQHLYEEKMPVLKSKIFSITIISIGKVFMLKSNPNPKKSNRQPIPKNYLKKCHLIGYSKWQRIQG